MDVIVSPDAQHSVAETSLLIALPVPTAIQEAPEGTIGAESQAALHNNQTPAVIGRESAIFVKASNHLREGTTFQEALAHCREQNSAVSPSLADKAVVDAVKTAFGFETEPVQKLIFALNKVHAVIDVGGKCRVMKEYTDHDTGLTDIQFSSPADFRSFYCNQKFVSSSGKETTLGVLWFNSPLRREYNGLTFNPKFTPPGYYNLWSGFAVDPRKGDCSRFLAHIFDNIASGNRVIYDYIIAWMAHGIQHPDELIGVAIALRGSMGTGKGVFANCYGSLFGRHFLQLTQGSQLTGKFNAHMKDKVLVFADEAFWAGDKVAEGVLKALITEPSMVIEGKGENAYKITNHLHFIFATNNDWVAPAGPQERRFFVVDVGEGRMQDHAYFEAILHEMDSGGREALLHYLMNYDVSNINLRQFPQTAALMEQKLYSMTPVQKFMFQKLETGVLSNPVNGWDEIPIQDLYAQFIAFCIRVGLRHRPSDSEFGTHLKKLFTGVTTAKGRSTTYGGHRPNIYRFPSLRDCRRTFERFINYQVEWPVYVDLPATEPEVATSVDDAAVTVVD